MPEKPAHVTIQRHTSVALKRSATPEDVPDPFDIDEWDPQRGAFWQHMVAGSLAGLMEHAVMFPVDTIKTHYQVMHETSSVSGLLAEGGGLRLWRGVQTMFAGTIPAHAAYFSIYEGFKPQLTDWLQDNRVAILIDQTTATPVGSTSAAVGAGGAVCIATVAHDLVMTPLDVVKQRLQLGHHQNSMVDCFYAILREQGPRAFVVSLPLTLCMNLPYAALMGASNEYIRSYLTGGAPPSTTIYMVSGATAGAIAAAITTPLDAIKTRLQTQHLSSSSRGGQAGSGLLYSSALQACAALYAEGGLPAFFRGMHARVLVHAPTVGICWTTYETIKHLLERAYPSERSPPPSTAISSRPQTAGVCSAEEGAHLKLSLVEHMIAGSLAGIIEHAAVYPIDTIKTNVQAATASEAATYGTRGITRRLISQHGITHLFRGLSALVPAIGPAHALMFSGYEQVLKLGGAKERGASAERVAMVGAAAGVVSTVLHDSCMVPAETIKQRLQLGYYRDAIDCFRAMLRSGGGSFFRSLPTTLAMNVPYCSLMMMSNESLKRWLNPNGEYHLGVYLFSGGFSGALAAGLTTPLDVVKTRLQVQSLTGSSAGVGAAPGDAYKLRYSGFLSAVRCINAESGLAGFWRGLGPRVAMYGPSCAVSWVAYESCKKLLVRARGDERAAGK